MYCPNCARDVVEAAVGQVCPVCGYTMSAADLIASAPGASQGQRAFGANLWLGALAVAGVVAVLWLGGPGSGRHRRR